MKNIPFIIKIAYKPVLILVLLVIFSLIGLSKGYSQVLSLRKELARVEKTENILKSKLNILTSNEDSVNTVFAVAYLPSENSSLAALYQLKNVAAQNGLLFTNYKVGSEVKESSDFVKSIISFELEGPLFQILNFVNMIKTVSPNIWIDKSELEFMGDLTRVKFYTKTYWSSFPTKIPALTDPITDLSQKDNEILSQIIDYFQPPFDVFTVDAARENLNPFGE